ncbi:polycomb group protein embryonic flower 2 [Phtheirospermum japonicum]|uniref:Polycomb group protein embryonic flower 2 n=1 Tax=Phtheirospermum japonicum TaxID=374723 RepID=A0A830B123_9LAMI|nr:polycomb group protein embryonic flower 2 [Phtheirospermum japonicum]
MPGIPLVARETAYSRGADHMCRQDPRAHLTPEEQVAAEESLSIYCKPVELIQMTISLPSTVNDESRIQSLFPLCILLARPVYSPAVVEDSAVYNFSRACILTRCTGDDRANQEQANFILPEINKLSAEVKSGSLSILFVSCAEIFKEHVEGSLFPANVGANCFLGKIPMEILQLSWEKSLNLSGGERAEMLSTVDLDSCFLKTSCFGDDKCFSFHSPPDGTVAKSQQLQVRISAEEVGAKDKSPYDSFSYSDIPSSTLPQIIRLRTGNVVFNYKYYNNKLHRTEVTEDFTCSFCLAKCGSFKGVRYHLLSSHDLFNFEFWVTEEFQAVNVSVKTDTWRSENIAAGVDPKQQTFLFCSKSSRRRKKKSPVQSSKHVHPLLLDLAPPGPNEPREKTDGKAEIGDRDASSPRASSATAHSCAEPECVQPLPASNLAPAPLLQFAKTRKLSIERSDPRSRALLQKRQFFHSHRAQPMAMEQVLSDRDSEDEVDDDVADLEDRREMLIEQMLDDFVDVTKDEKQLMHLWNSFVRKQRVLADGHIPWACEAFSRLHRQDLVQTPALQW